MKFGKRVRGLASKEWANDYVDYKQLKKHVRRLQAQVSAQQQQQQQGKHEKETAVGQAATAFHGLLAREMTKLNAAHGRIQEQLEHFELLGLRNSLGNRWVLSPAKARSLLLDAIETSHKVDAFRRFVVLNSLALVKITKKFDKAVAGANLRLGVLDDLKQQPFYDAECLDRICAEAAALTDRIMLCVLPDGNFRIDCGEVACPICLVAEVKTPITLACAHTFCWSCLSKAAEHRFHSCPLCRKEQSLDPRYYEIDGLLKRFKRAYAFVEAGLDRAPFASYRMRQILAEAFELVNAYLSEVDEQYAAVSPPASVCGDASETSSFAESNEYYDESAECENSNKTLPGGHDGEYQTRGADELAPAPESLADAVLAELERGDPVEICCNGSWYPGMVMQCNPDATYSVLWWVHDNSQRFGQRVARAQLREPHVGDVAASGGYLLIDAAAGAWRTATEWALEPFRRLRSLSQAERVVS
ncbi:hypothetical protein PybrP1_009893 [[Pythium] brassicae (nom. inval.)]|nr:hypothetical protein PybrP1_009893 [[Pythium] brassicae (nom. inval.)]